MSDATKRRSLQSALLVGLAFVYFLVFPEDLSDAVSSLENYLKLVRSVLELTTAISSGLYAVGAAGLLGWAATDVTRRILAERARQGRAAEPASGVNATDAPATPKS